MVETITYYSANAANRNQAWVAYCVISGSPLWVRFEGATEAQAVERANLWYDVESTRNRAGTVELESDEVKSDNYKPKTGWGSSFTGWSAKEVSNSVQVLAPTGRGHANAGKVWLANAELKQKRRVDPAEVDAMMAQGWFKAGPRTQV